MGVLFINTLYYPPEKTRKGLSNLQMEISYARSQIRAECEKLPNGHFIFICRIQRLANEMRSRLKVIIGEKQSESDCIQSASQ